MCTIKSPTFLSCVLALLFIASSCNTTRVVKPLEKGSLQIGADLGGPMIKFSGAPIFIPLTSVHAAYGIKKNTTLFGSIHSTSLLFGVFQTDIGITKLISKQQGLLPGVSLSPIANLMVDRWQGAFSLYPQLDANFFWNYKQKPHYFYTSLNNWFELRQKRAHGETQPSNWMPSIALGHQWVKQKYHFQLELKYIGFNQNNQNIVVDYIAPGSTGTLGLYFGIKRTF